MQNAPTALPLRSDHYRSTHQASVIAILGEEAPPVYSYGSRFFNTDRWTLLCFMSEMDGWAKKNPKKNPTRKDISDWVVKANDTVAPTRMIVIAATPENLDQRAALALVGGGYHEALHTYMSCRRDITVKEAADIVLPRWNKVPDWSKVVHLLDHFTRIIEDIRIERVGREIFPGIGPRLAILQDLILCQEEAARATMETLSDVDVLSAAFRDIALDYDTEIQDHALDVYNQMNARIVEMVESGSLAPEREAAEALSEPDVLGSLRVAMDIVGKIAHFADQMKPPPPQNLGGDNKIQCPICGASGDKIKGKAATDENGNKIPDKASLSCSACGWESSLEFMPAGVGSPDGVAIDGMTAPADGGSGDTTENDGEPQGASGAGSGVDPNPERPGGTESNPDGAGGHYWEEGDPPGWKVLLDEIQQNGGSWFLDVAAALQAAFDHEVQKENDSCRKDEMVWRPYSPGLDSFSIVGPSKEGKTDDMMRADQLLQSVKEECSFLRARLRSLIWGVAQRSVSHGVRRGVTLSEPMLVDTALAVRSGCYPDRAFQVVDEKIDTSLAAVAIIDESGSMSYDKKLTDAARTLMALTEPLDALRCPVLVAGFRNGQGSPSFTPMSGFHRIHGVHHDVFKTFDERFTVVRWRFANTMGGGSTPMSDGVQFGLDALRGRTETHRLLFIVTDGQPDSGHQPIINRQVRMAKEEGIYVIGVGLGPGSAYVKNVFPDHVWSNDIKEIPILLLAKLNTLLDFRRRKRGTRLPSRV